MVTALAGQVSMLVGPSSKDAYWSCLGKAPKLRKAFPYRYQNSLAVPQARLDSQRPQQQTRLSKPPSMRSLPR